MKDEQSEQSVSEEEVWLQKEAACSLKILLQALTQLLISREQDEYDLYTCTSSVQVFYPHIPECCYFTQKLLRYHI